MKLGSIKGKLESMEEMPPMPAAEGEGEVGLPLEEMPAEESEEMGEPVDLASVSDELLLEEAKKRGLV